MKGKLALGSIILLSAVGCAHSNKHETRLDPVAAASRLELGRYVCAPQVRRLPCTRGVDRGRDYGYVLTTHCGVYDGYFDGRLWVTRRRLTGTPGNPPRWIDNPLQRGTMRLVSSHRAEFRARSHTIVFEPAPRWVRIERCE